MSKENAKIGKMLFNVYEKIGCYIKCISQGTSPSFLDFMKT
jgi:hypothetical protein